MQTIRPKQDNHCDKCPTETEVPIFTEIVHERRHTPKQRPRKEVIKSS